MYLFNSFLDSKAPLFYFDPSLACVWSSFLPKSASAPSSVPSSPSVRSVTPRERGGSNDRSPSFLSPPSVGFSRLSLSFFLFPAPWGLTPSCECVRHTHTHPRAPSLRPASTPDRGELRHKGLSSAAMRGRVNKRCWSKNCPSVIHVLHDLCLVWRPNLMLIKGISLLPA